MTRNEIEHMWKVASNNPNHDTNWHDPVVVKFAALVASAEREACAKEADKRLQYKKPWVGLTDDEIRGCIEATIEITDLLLLDAVNAVIFDVERLLREKNI